MSFALTDNLPGQHREAPYRITGLDGEVEIYGHPALDDLPVSISIALTDSEIGIPSNTVVSFSRSEALALAYALIAAVERWQPQSGSLRKVVPGCPGDTRDIEPLSVCGGMRS